MTESEARVVIFTKTCPRCRADLTNDVINTNFGGVVKIWYCMACQRQTGKPQTPSQILEEAMEQG